MTHNNEPSIDDIVNGFLMDYDTPVGDMKWDDAFRPLRNHDFVIQDMADWLRTALTEQYKKGVEEERSKSTAMVEIAKKHIIQKHLQHIPLDDEEWMKGKSKVECVNEVYQWVIDYLTQHHDTHR